MLLPARLLNALLLPASLLPGLVLAPSLLRIADLLWTLRPRVLPSLRIVRLLAPTATTLLRSLSLLGWLPLMG
ncbi:MAG: hypothetical protein QOF10_5180 [Kribbellaceae bacterium]|nr:hypothetical protein [Kribbellaceae bacterium]